MPCDNCKWGVQAPIDQNNIGAKRPIQCFRMPPSVVLVPTQQGAAQMSVFPVVNGDTECGEYEIKQGQEN